MDKTKRLRQGGILVGYVLSWVFLILAKGVVPFILALVFFWICSFFTGAVLTDLFPDAS